MYHQAALLYESVEGLAILPGGVYADLTFGGGGHSRLILQKLGPAGRLYAFDKDEDAEANLPDDPRLTLLKHDFRFLRNVLKLEGVEQLDGILADLGISSHQIDTPGRGFSTRFDGPLDMRMSNLQNLSAADVVNKMPEKELAGIFRNYGELSQAQRIAACIIQARQVPIHSTSALRDALKPVTPAGFEHKFLAQVFQALRISVNDEMEALRRMLIQSVQVLKPGGRIAIIAYHSLEDRLVKNFFKTGNFEGKEEKDFFGNSTYPLRPVTRKPIVPSEAEITENPRARSAKLRIAEKMS